VLWGSASFVTGMHKAPAQHASGNLGSNPGGSEGGCSFPSLLFDRCMAAEVQCSLFECPCCTAINFCSLCTPHFDREALVCRDLFLVLQ
jgi:hypothetical protein